MIEWRIYYGDGSTFSNEDGSPVDAPALNVQAIVQRDTAVGRTIWHKKDFYLHLNDEWIGVDWFGLLDHLMAMGIVKAGRTLTMGEFHDLYRRAANDPDMPHKSALAPFEDGS